MKIAIYVSSWPPGRVASGIVTYTSQLVSSLRAFGHEVYILTPDAGEKDPYTIDIEERRFSALSRVWQRVTAATLSLPYASVQRAARIAAAVRQLVDEEGVEVVEIEESFGWSAAVSRMSIVPVSVRLHGPFFLTGEFNDAMSAMPFNKGRAKQEGVAIKSAQYITTPCKYVRDAVSCHYDLPLVNSTVIPTPIASLSESEIWKLDCCNRNKILFVGRFDSIKGGDLVLQAFAKLAVTNPDLKLTFIGPDQGLKSPNGTVFFEEFFGQNFPQELRGRVDYLGQLGHEELMALRTSHYLTLIAARYDTMGYMLLEPMSFGCPLVATSVGGISEVIENERNGLLIPGENVDAMVEACQRLLDNPDLAVQLGRQAWKDCSELYSPETVATQSIEGYKKAIEAFRRKETSN